jgi:hypothetical protein
MRPIITRVALLLALVCSVGCASYAVPSQASAEGASTPQIAANFARTARPVFPARIAVIRADALWDPASLDFQRLRENRDAHYVEKYFDKTKPPLLEGITFAPPGMKFTRHGYVEVPVEPTPPPTMYLAIKFTHQSHNESFEVGPLGLLTLGLMPNHFVVSDASACFALIDAQTGCIYALADASDRAIQIHNVWTTSAANNDAEERAQDRALAKLGKQFPSLWLNVVEQYAARSAGN